MEQTTPPQTTTSPVLYEKLSMEKAKKLAKQLQQFAKDNNLTANIAGKQYMQVEGWQFIGTQMGLTDVVQTCEPIPSENPKEIKYKAEVTVINQNGTIISRGFAFASNQEKKKTTFEEYAVASMAQTRAIGKAYRNFLSWIVKMAGYEATPFEEVDKNKIETDLAKAKQTVLKALNDAGIDDSSEMIRVIETATGKATLDTVDDANKVIGYLKELEEEK